MAARIASRASRTSRPKIHCPALAAERPSLRAKLPGERAAVHAGSRARWLAKEVPHGPRRLPPSTDGITQPCERTDAKLRLERAATSRPEQLARKQFRP